MDMIEIQNAVEMAEFTKEAVVKIWVIKREAFEAWM